VIDMPGRAERIGQIGQRRRMHHRCALLRACHHPSRVRATGSSIRPPRGAPSGNLRGFSPAAGYTITRAAARARAHSLWRGRGRPSRPGRP
jgi:hypothetical protein